MRPLLFGLISLLAAVPASAGLFHDLSRYDWQGPKVLAGAGGAVRTEGGVEIWINGEPRREYLPIEIVEVSTTGSIGVQGYLFRVLRKETKAKGGDGFIILAREANVGGSIQIGSSTTQATASLYGTNATIQGTSISSSVSVPIQNNTYRALIFRYKR